MGNAAFCGKLDCTISVDFLTPCNTVTKFWSTVYIPFLKCVIVEASFTYFTIKYSLPVMLMTYLFRAGVLNPFMPWTLLIIWWSLWTVPQNNVFTCIKLSMKDCKGNCIKIQLLRYFQNFAIMYICTSLLTHKIRPTGGSKSIGISK